MSDDTVTFRLRPALGVRVLGVAFLGLALAVVLEVVRRSVPALDVAFAVVGWAVLVLVVVVAGWGLWALFGSGVRLVLDADGLRNRTSWRRDSARSVRWTEVADVRRSDVPTGTVFVVVLTDGRQSLIVTRLLNVSVPELEQQLQGRLNSAHGYRPL